MTSTHERILRAADEVQDLLDLPLDGHQRLSVLDALRVLAGVAMVAERQEEGVEVSPEAGASRESWSSGGVVIPDEVTPQERATAAHVERVTEGRAHDAKVHAGPRAAAALTKVCGWCGVILSGPPPGDPPGLVSHGMCTSCFAAESARQDADKVVRPSRRDWSRAECTRDPIFLYQTRERVERVYPWEDEARLFGPWSTPESVWLSREEGERWGRSNEHNYPAGCWRVFCVCAAGELAALLTEHVGAAP